MLKAKTAVAGKVIIQAHTMRSTTLSLSAFNLFLSHPARTQSYH